MDINMDAAATAVVLQQYQYDHIYVLCLVSCALAMPYIAKWRFSTVPGLIQSLLL